MKPLGFAVAFALTVLASNSGSGAESPTPPPTKPVIANDAIAKAAVAADGAWSAVNTWATAAKEKIHEAAGRTSTTPSEKPVAP